MSNVQRDIAARYAPALKASSTLSAPSGDGRPTAADIWLYKLEDAVCIVVRHGRARRMPHGKYDHNWQYGHRHCLRTVEDVRAAPDDSFLEAHGLPNVARQGWLHFMIRDRWDTGGRMDVVKLETCLLANPKALNLLRLPENFEVALTVARYLSWVYVPGAHYAA